MYMWRPEEGVRCPGAGVTGSYIAWYEYRKPNSSLLENHVLPTAEPLLQPNIHPNFTDEEIKAFEGINNLLNIIAPKISGRIRLFTP